MMEDLAQFFARRLIIGDPASVLFDHFGGRIEKLDIDFQFWALKKFDKVHHYALEEILAEKMRRLLLRSSQIPFWKSIFRDASFDPAAIKYCRDIECLPITSRQQLRAVGIKYRSNADLSKDALGGFGGTSGTTGVPMGLFFSKKAEIRSRALLLWIVDKIKRDIGVQKLSPFVVLNLGVAPHMRLYKNMVYIDGRDLENRERRNQIVYPLILQNKPSILYVYPSLLKRLIYWLRHDGIEPVLFKAIIYLAEHLYDGEKTFIKNFFRCPLYSFYGTKEGSFMAMECSSNEGFHLLKGWGYLEIVSSDGAVLPLGSWGRIIYTNFENEATPFIRYDTGDNGMLYDAGICACGIMGLKLIFEGRAVDFVTLPNGTFFPLIKLSGGVSRIFHDIILQLQFQEFTDKIGVNIVPVRAFSETEIEELILVCQNLVGAPIKFEVFLKERLAATAGGKTPLIVK